MPEIYEVTAVEGKSKRIHKVYVRAASHDRADKFGRELHRLFGVRGKFETPTAIWNPLADLSTSRYTGTDVVRLLIYADRLQKISAKLARIQS